MATITSAQAGNWSATSTWVGGIVPVSGDTIVLLHVVTLNVDITGISILTHSGNNNLLINGTSRNFDIYVGGSPISSNGVVQVINTNLTHTVNGTITFDINHTANGRFVFRGSSPCNYNLNYAGIIIGSAAAGNSNALHIVEGAASVVNINGTVAVTGGVGIALFQTGSVSGIQNTINGSYICTNPFGIIFQNSGFANNTVLMVNGISTSSGLSNYQMPGSTGEVIVSGTHINSNTIGYFPFTLAFGVRFKKLSGQNVQLGLLDTLNGVANLYTADLLTGYPLEAKVEDGTVYGPSSEFEGTLSPVNVNTQQLAEDLITELFNNGTPWATPQFVTAAITAITPAP